MVIVGAIRSIRGYAKWHIFANREGTMQIIIYPVKDS